MALMLARQRWAGGSGSGSGGGGGGGGGSGGGGGGGTPAPWASRGRYEPGVRHTPGITAAAVAPGVAIIVMPRVVPTPPARATVHIYIFPSYTLQKSCGIRQV